MVAHLNRHYVGIREEAIRHQLAARVALLHDTLLKESVVYRVRCGIERWCKQRGQESDKIWSCFPELALNNL